MLSCPACGVTWPCALPCPVHAVSSAVVSCCCLVAMVCGVVGGECVCGVRAVGYPPIIPPLVVVVGGAIVDGGVA